MISTTYEQRRCLERLNHEALVGHQLKRLNALLACVLPHNAFYAEKLAGISLPITSMEEIAQLPFTYKDEIAHTTHSDFSANLTYPVENYIRLHRTSGTRGRPAVILDTAEDWQWWVDTWQFV